MRLDTHPLNPYYSSDIGPGSLMSCCPAVRYSPTKHILVSRIIMGYINGFTREAMYV